MDVPINLAFAATHLQYQFHQEEEKKGKKKKKRGR